MLTPTPIHHQRTAVFQVKTPQHILRNHTTKLTNILESCLPFVSNNVLILFTLQHYKTTQIKYLYPQAHYKEKVHQWSEDKVSLPNTLETSVSHTPCSQSRSCLLVPEQTK